MARNSSKPPQRERLRPHSSRNIGEVNIRQTKKAERFLKQHPGILRLMRRGFDILKEEAPGATHEEGGIHITLLERIKKTYGQAGLYRVSIGGTSYFIKEVFGTTGNQQKSINQIRSMQQAEKILREHNIYPLQYEFGLETPERSYLVAHFIDLPQVIKLPEGPLKMKLKRRISKAQNELAITHDIRDLLPLNCFYDQKQDRLIAFDLY